MSTPRCIRLAIEACKPYKVRPPIWIESARLTFSQTSFSRPRASIIARPFSSTRSTLVNRKPSPDSVTHGFPDPPTPQLASQNSPQPVPANPTAEEAVVESDFTTPPKRSTPPIARPYPTEARGHEGSNALVSVAETEKGNLRRPPRNVAAAYLKPLRRKARYGVPTCDLQLRSYSVRNVEFMADFAMRAAYYLGLPASGPTPLPKIIERWTTLRSNFVNKKSQENFERITLRRLVQIQDGHPETVQVWLAFLRKHAFYGVGMKANVWQHEELGRLIHGLVVEMKLTMSTQRLGRTWTKRFQRSKRSSMRNLLLSAGTRVLDLRSLLRT